MKIRLLFVFFVILTLSCDNNTPQRNSILDQVPNNTAVLIKINDFNQLKNQVANNDFINRLSKTEAYTSTQSKIAFLKNIEILGQSVLGFANEKDSTDFFLISNRDSLKLNQENLSQQQIDHKTGSYIKIDAEGESIFKLDIDNQSFLCSSELLVENFLNKSNLSPTDPKLIKLFKTASSSKPASVIVNTELTHKLLAPYFLKDSTLNLNSLVNWVMLDMDLPQKRIGLSGIGFTNDSLPQIAKLFKSTNAITNNIQNYAPKNAEAILSFTFNDFTVFNKNRLQYYNLKNPTDTIFNTVEEVGLIWQDENKSVMLQTYGIDNLAEYLNNYKKNVSEYQGAQIITLKKNTILNNSFEPLLKDFEANFYVVLDDAFVFSQKKEQLQKVITNYKNGTTLSNSDFYMNAKEVLAEESSILFLSKASEATPFIEQYFSPKALKDHKTAKLDNYFYALQLVSDEGFFHLNTSLQQLKTDKKNKGVSKMFTVQLENDLITNPQFVLNHRTKKKEIVVQDINDQLYLISTEGKVLWKKQLKGKIQGKISQIDIYKNGRLQLAFTTENQFLVLDRNGKEVEPFNMEFKTGGLNDLAVFDYEKRKDYRFFITQNKNTYVYNNKGKIVDGFTYKKASGNILSAPQHFRVSRKDYLVFKQDDGLKILSRTGKERVKGFPKVGLSDNEARLYKNNFTVTDTKGTLIQIDQKGKTAQTKFNLNKDHGFDATSKTLVLMDNNTLTIKGKRIELDLGVYSKPSIFYINNKIYVSVTDIQNQKIYLFDSIAKPIPGFPIYSNSVIDMADIDNDKKPELVAKDLDNSIVVYRIN